MCSIDLKKEIFHFEFNRCVIHDQILMSVLKKSMNVMNTAITQLAVISATVLDLAIDFTAMELHVKVHHKSLLDRCTVSN